MSLARACQSDCCGGIVCYAGVDWWYHPHGHSECQILSRLAKRVPVLWVNSIGMRAPTPGKTDLLLRRYWRKLRSTLKGLRRDKSGMWIYSPFFVPRYTERVVEFNGHLLAAQIRSLCHWLKIRNPAVWVTVPTAAPAVGRGKWSRVVFNRCDDFSTFPEADGALVSTFENRLLEQADHVLYVNRELFDRERARVKDARYIGHGVDYSSFASARLSGKREPGPVAIRDLPRPIIGFYGALEDYRVDLELLVKVARHVFPGTLLVLGPRTMNISRLLAEPNVTYLGPIPHAELPAYAAQFDVGIMPFLQNEFNAVCNPIKLKEYLALGYPIAAIRFPALEPYEHLVWVADSHEEFLVKLDCALREDDPQMVERRQQAVAGDSWDALAECVAEIMGVPPLAASQD